MLWLTAQSTQDENCEDSSSGVMELPGKGEKNNSYRDQPLLGQPVHDASCDVPAQPLIQPLQYGLDDGDALLSHKIQQLQYELEVCKQLGREAEGRRIEERKRLQANLDSKRRELTRTLQKAKTNISYFEYCRIIRQSFDAGVVESGGQESESVPEEQQEQQQLQRKSPSSTARPLHRSWYGWCEGFLLRGIHHAMMTKDQLDIVQRNCNSLLMEVYADRLPRLNKEKELVEKTWTAAIIQMEQYLARRQYFQQRSLDLRRQIQKRYSGGEHQTKTSFIVGPPASSPHTPCMGTPTKGILKNSSGKSTNRWEEDRPNNHGAGLSPPTRQQTNDFLWTEDDEDDNDDDDDSNVKSLEYSSKIPIGSSSVPILSSQPAFPLQPTRESCAIEARGPPLSTREMHHP